MTPGETIQGRYRLVEALGSGGMATVWLAQDERLDRPVALKCLAPRFAEDAEFLVRFFIEAQAVASLSHPNIVKVLDFGDEADTPYLVMEYMPGGSVADLAGTPITQERALDLVAGAARGAGAAHAAGLVHRDLKPANILLADDGAPKIGDFGIAVGSGQERLTATGTALGSPHYVSPEQASGRPIGPASDVYALGVVLYELITGVKPFPGDNPTALAIAHVEQEPEPPSAHVPDLPPAVEAVVMTCLAKDPQKRFGDGAALATALDAVADDQNTAAIAIPTFDDGVDEEPRERNARRAASVALLTALFLGLLVFGVMALGNRDSEEKAVAGTDRSRSMKREEPSSNGSSRTPAHDKDDHEGAGSVPGTPGPTESATPSPAPIEDGAEGEDREDPPSQNRADDNTNDQEDDEPTEEETPAPEPTSEPTSEPTAESTPAP